MKVAALQMVSGQKVDANLRAADNLLQAAASGGAELAALPEYFCLMGQRDTDKVAVQEREGDGPIQQFLADAARRYSMWIVGGTLPLATNNPSKVYNACLVFNPQGQSAARYDKIHLFAFDNGQERYDESRVIQPGTAPRAINIASRDGQTWRVGLSVCYDLRFAALYRTLAADLLMVPSAFTYPTGQAHWEVLLRARAVENLAYVLAPAQGGTHDNGRRTWGHSMAVDPWGQVIDQRAEGAGVVFADLSMAHLQQLRSQLPALGHHRPLPAALA
jgi:deaminated glutathione amidase